MKRATETAVSTAATTAKKFVAVLLSLALAGMLIVVPGAGTALAAPQTAPAPDHVIQPKELVGKWSPDPDADEPHYIEIYYSKGHLVYYYYRMVYDVYSGLNKGKTEFEYNHGYIALQGNHGTCDLYTTNGKSIYLSLYVDQASSGCLYDQETGKKYTYMGKADGWRSYLSWPTKPDCYDATTGATVSGKTTTGSNSNAAAPMTVGNLAATEVGYTNARLSATAYKTPSVNVTACGLYLGTSEGTMQKCNTESVGQATNNYRNGNGFDIWYDLNDELNIRLMSGTKYYYQFYCISNGVEYRSPVATFTTR